MSTHYQVQISVEVQDLEQLRAYALQRALNDCTGMTEAEFTDGEHDDPEDNVSYWLGWCFDAGTPPRCGFQIENSEVVYEGTGDEGQDRESYSDTQDRESYS